ncbi:peptidase T [Anaerolineales bacterium HSG25]|nr:peptidase T [Anaerolineales bacterium HSG25]
MTDYRTDLETRFLRYVQIDTTSDDNTGTVPSTDKQYDLLNLLVDELTELGAQEINLTDYATVFATIPATIDRPNLPVVGLLAHVDTSPAVSGTGVKPTVHRNYDGQPIILPAADLILNEQSAPELKQKIGQDIVTTDGTTLLGADDKAGVAIVMTLAKQLLADTTIPHGEIRLCFTPDEEIGHGVTHLKLEDLNVDVAYTLDGGNTGEVQFETFSADKAEVTITGVPAHPGYAKGILVNAVLLAGKFIEALPQNHHTPETTAEREGYIHVYEITGGATKVALKLILRDFDRENLKAHGEQVKAICEQIQALEPRATIECKITKQYRNMRDWLKKDMTPVNKAIVAAKRASLDPQHTIIRGGTDGARLTERGVPTPNLFTGMQNIHSCLEWVSLHDMEKSVQMCLQLVQLWAEEE